MNQCRLSDVIREQIANARTTQAAEQIVENSKSSKQEREQIRDVRVPQVVEQIEERECQWMNVTRPHSEYVEIPLVKPTVPTVNKIAVTSQMQIIECIMENRQVQYQEVTKRMTMPQFPEVMQQMSVPLHATRIHHHSRLHVDATRRIV